MGDKLIKNNIHTKNNMMFNFLSFNSRYFIEKRNDKYRNELTMGKLKMEDFASFSHTT
jgi:hypothetical protein